MKCPGCKQDQLKVIDSRPHDEFVYRRRKCLACGYKFSTQEVVVAPMGYHGNARVRLQDVLSSLSQIRKALINDKSAAVAELGGPVQGLPEQHRQRR